VKKSQMMIKLKENSNSLGYLKEKNSNKKILKRCFENMQRKALKLGRRDERKETKKKTIANAKPDFFFCHKCRSRMEATQ
jgi:hypothetical protein